MTNPHNVEPGRPEAPVDMVELRRRQRARSRVMAWGLAGLALLFFLITMAKIGISKAW